VPAPEEVSQSQVIEYPTWWGRPPTLQKTIPCKNPGKCVECHEETARMDPSHALACVKCHGGDPKAEEKPAAHKGLIPDPGDLKIADKTCGKCHPDSVTRVRSSAMALAPRLINHTRFAFAAQKSSDPVHAVADQDDLKKIPLPSRSGNLADDLLRRSCLRCHLHTRGSARWGEHRGQGCSACHVAYPNSKDGKPRSHQIVRNVGMTACLKCHNANHVGGDYVGLFEKDTHRGFRSPIVKGKQAPTIYGAEQHRLIADVHFRAGMECMDCHTLDEVHGSGETPKSALNNVKISCAGCHVTGDHPAVLKSDDGKLQLLKGEPRAIPSWNPDLVPHKIAEHRERLRCSACHAAWSYQDYGFHLMLEERADYWKWAVSAAQNDPQVQELLARNAGTVSELIPPLEGSRANKPQEQWEPPTTIDWLNGEARPGAWFRGYTARRWSLPPLGVDHNGKVSVMRPMYQYVVSHVDAKDNLLLDRRIPTTGAGKPALIMNPYEPHTTSKQGRACHECHGNPKAAGLGEGRNRIGKPGFAPTWIPEKNIPDRSFRWDALVDDKGNPLQFSSHPRSGPLDKDTVKILLNPSRRHRLLWYRHLTGTPDPLDTGPAPK
jgi:hypothetical protein